MATQLAAQPSPQAATAPAQQPHSDAEACGLLSPPCSPPSAPGLPVARAATTAHQHGLSSVARTEADIVASGRRLGIPEPVPWGRLKALVCAGDIGPLGRSYAMQARYEKHSLHVKQKCGSMASYLLSGTLASFIARTQAPGFDPRAPMGDDDFEFRINDFPYHTGDGVEHWVLWCIKPLQPGFAAPAAVARTIRRRFGDRAEWVYIVNPPHRQSVPQLSHAHVFVNHGSAGSLSPPRGG